MRYKSLLFIIIFLLPQPSLSEPVIRLSSITNSKNALIAEEIVRLAYQRAGYDIRVIYSPGWRALYQSNSGETDGELFRISGIEQKYNHLIPIPVPINVLNIIGISRSPIEDKQSWPQLENRQLGVQRGVVFIERAANAHSNLKIVYANDNTQLIKMLMADRIEIAVMSDFNRPVLTELLQREGNKLYLTNIESLPVYHYIHERNISLKPQLTRALEELRDSGEIQRIRTRHLKPQE